MISREFNKQYFGPGSMAVMIGGILCLCQPWSAFLHSWSVLVMIIGLICFLGGTLGRDFPPGLLQELADLPWPLT